MNYQEEILSMCENAHVVFIYIAKHDKVETRGVIKELLRAGKRVVVPVCDVATKHIVASEILSLGECEEGAYGICEPTTIRAIEKEEIDVYIVPGTQFDKTGNRKGRGLGYFDRFLVDVKGNKPIIGLCYKDQMMEKIEPQPWDIPVDKVVVVK
jgi:5-formyltetrahydrofolate cyclo-ligase